MARELVTSTRTNLSEVERNILTISREINRLDKYNLATGKLKKKYVKKVKLTVLEKIQLDFKQLN